MSVVEFILLLLVALVCGSLAQAIAGYSHGGCLVTIVIGFIGALLGTWLARAAGIEDILAITIGGKSFPVIWSVIGGALFAAVLGLITRRPRNA